MIAKKASPGSGRHARKELQLLYARRMAIDDVIRSLEQYDRFRVKIQDIRKLKTA